MIAIGAVLKILQRKYLIFAKGIGGGVFLILVLIVVVILFALRRNSKKRESALLELAATNANREILDTNTDQESRELKEKVPELTNIVIEKYIGVGKENRVIILNYLFLR